MVRLYMCRTDTYTKVFFLFFSFSPFFNVTGYELLALCLALFVQWFGFFSPMMLVTPGYHGRYRSYLGTGTG